MGTSRLRVGAVVKPPEGFAGPPEGSGEPPDGSGRPTDGRDRTVRVPPAPPVGITVHPPTEIP
ncbi:hypothetical protein GCM10025875_23750 [Litorihabitans aurantiacus]|uniref:Uncharacterized protein n=1 Tax=Litorihabitans aurantiacus TaxID=1930061 RepID=A0AA37XFD5_9MICO|nr:hypothetical protein GCM10025875_23750 [Litorihabitans aurantiacus]